MASLEKSNRDPIIVTVRALNQVSHLLEQKLSDGAIGIRILIKQKGCSGLKYILEYAYDIRLLEIVVEKVCDDGKKIKILIDPKSIMFMLGTKIDYKEELFSSGFVFENPNEKGRCGCGESFHV